MSQAMCRGCFQTRGDCREHEGVMVCKRCWPRRATIAQKVKVER